MSLNIYESDTVCTAYVPLEHLVNRRWYYHKTWQLCHYLSHHTLVHFPKMQTNVYVLYLIQQIHILWNSLITWWIGTWGLFTTRLKNWRYLLSQYLTTVAESSLISLHLFSQVIVFISSSLYIFLSTFFPNAQSNSGHFVAAADWETNSTGNPSYLIIANASFFFLSKYAGEFLRVLNI